MCVDNNSCVYVHISVFPKARQTRKLLVANLKQNMGVRTTLLITVNPLSSLKLCQ